MLYYKVDLKVEDIIASIYKEDNILERLAKYYIYKALKTLFRKEIRYIFKKVATTATTKGGNATATTNILTSTDIAPISKGTVVEAIVATSTIV